jgi:hypothetical protein
LEPSGHIQTHRYEFAAVALAAVAFLLGINWGLPSRQVDRFLFGDEPVWSGAKIAKLAPSDANVLGADVDANPILNLSGPIVLNETDEQRAEIIRRYRLFSYQPDEMITLRSLSRIGQHRGDPRLYQYGGLWIYPVGAMLKAASLLGLIELKADQAYYLDNPQAFGRFYVVARLYTVMWGLVAVWAVYWIVQRLTEERLLATIAAICFAVMPVVLTMAHEAKPHLPALALILLAVIAAAKHIETDETKWAVAAGVLCGAAFGMVLSGLMAFAVLPIMVLLRGGRISQRLMLLVMATAAGLLTYLLCNPFVVFNALFHPEVLRSNLTNSTNMYRIGVGGAWNALSLIVEGASPVVVVAGIVGVVVLLFTHMTGRRADGDGGNVGWLLAAPAAAVLAQFILLANNKPPEYARFALVPNVLLLVAAMAAIGKLRSSRSRVALATGVMIATAIFGAPYLIAFINDSAATTSRLEAALRLTALRGSGNTIVRVTAEPAPYCLPPMDIFQTRMMLAPADHAIVADAMVTVDTQHSPAPISWADVRFIIVSAGAPHSSPRPPVPATVSSSR